MGFSIVAAFAVVGVSLIMCIEIFTGGFFPMVTNVDFSFDDMGERALEMAHTDINITNVSTSAFGPNYNHSITVRNTGSITLNTNDFTVLINGVLQSFLCPDSYIYPEQQTCLNVSNLPGNGDQRVKVIAKNCISDYFEYVI